ncbi:MAG: glycosyltransferase 61 family protein [Pseudomonadota bacterium]
MFDARGAFLPLSRARLSRDRLSGVPTAEAPVHRLRGTYLYAGVSHDHFGHFLLESLPRIWALGQLDRPPDGLVLPARAGKEMGPPLPKRLARLVQRLCGDLPVHVLPEATQVDRLILPSPGFGHGPWLRGTPAFHTHVQAQLQDLAVDGHARLYLSRSRLKQPDKAVDQEAEIEAMMEAAGYFVFQPERFHLDIQLGVMRAARQIVGADGSAFHLAAMAMRRDARAAIFLRRNRPEMLAYLSWQMQGFAGVTPTCIDARARPLPMTTPAPLDLGVLRRALEDAGFL